MKEKEFRRKKDSWLFPFFSYFNGEIKNKKKLKRKREFICNFKERKK
jgi:hypothetical protein